MKRWVKYTVAAVVVVVLIGGIVLAQRGGRDEQTRTVRAERGDVKQDVAFTGNLEAAQSATMGFESAGSVTNVYVELGEQVEAGQHLVRLDSRLASLEFAKARADAAAAQEQKQLAWQTAEADLAKTKAENDRALAKQRQAVRDAKKELDQQRSVVDKTQHESAGTATAETSVLTQRVKESAYSSARQALLELTKTVEKSNTLKQQAAYETKAAYDATVQAAGNVGGLSSLEASRQLAAVRLSKTLLTAPFAGVVTLQEADVGEYMAPGTVVVTVATVDDLELTADVPETDAAKLSVGAAADVTFDVYGSAESYPAELVAVAPAAKLIEGVPTFEVKLRLISSDPKFKPGLTANITVHAAEKKGVVAVPRRAVITRDGKEFVRVKEPFDRAQGKGEREVEVKTGLLGSDGRVEIISGLSGGEEIVLANGAS
ncbi:MAG: efflux RND transporter periplasmic adaptor subunit [Patescibacteria group bacterium]